MKRYRIEGLTADGWSISAVGTVDALNWFESLGEAEQIRQALAVAYLGEHDSLADSLAALRVIEIDGQPNQGD